MEVAMAYDRHEEATVVVAGAPSDVFALLDDQIALGAHMSRPSAMMAGGRMDYELDAAQGKAVGSVIRMSGAMLGLRLSVTEKITERAAPVRKAWETQGPQNMLVIDAYRMGFEIQPEGKGSRVRVFIDYRLPRSAFSFMAASLSRIYARWCIGRMAGEAVKRFGRLEAPAPTRTTSNA
jgi:hypothetical protein